jgi:hypothetical protein
VYKGSRRDTLHSQPVLFFLPFVINYFTFYNEGHMKKHISLEQTTHTTHTTYTRYNIIIFLPPHGKRVNFTLSRFHSGQNQKYPIRHTYTIPSRTKCIKSLALLLWEQNESYTLFFLPSPTRILNNAKYTILILPPPQSLRRIVIVTNKIHTRKYLQYYSSQNQKKI